jgi:hypothetical protein
MKKLRMRKRSKRRLALTVLATSVASRAGAAELRGSRSSMEHQHGIAVGLDYGFIATPSQVKQYVAKGQLEAVRGNTDYQLSGVSFPYARPEVRMFVERLGAQYHEETGDPLVVTSLTRPTTLQPSNASALSVHPAGMAVDLRIPTNAKDRAWLERTLLELEAEGVLDVTREEHPPHFHVAVFPDAYRAHVARLDSIALAAEEAAAAAAAAALAPPVVAAPVAVAAPAAAQAPASESRAAGSSSLVRLLIVLAPFGFVAAAVAAAVARRRDVEQAPLPT